MKLSTRARYGTRALIDIALHDSEGPVLLRDIARREDISEPYLEHVITPLRVAGLLKSLRGVRGGFVLAKPPSQIIISQVVQILEGSLSLTDCVDNPAACARSPQCVTRDVWQQMGSALRGALGSTTLQDLLDRQTEKEQTLMYHI